MRVNTHFADEDVIDMYAEYLERQFELDQPFVAVLEFEKDKAQRKWPIKVVVSQATFGYLHHSSNEEICQQLEEFDGKATCLARIKQDGLTKQYEDFLDLDVHLIMGFDEELADR